MKAIYLQDDADVDSAVPYFYSYPSVACVSFLARRWRVMEKMGNGERKETLFNQWAECLKQFLRIEAAESNKRWPELDAKVEKRGKPKRRGAK